MNFMIYPSFFHASLILKCIDESVPSSFFKNYFAPKLELDLIGGVKRLDVGAFILGGEIEAPRRSRIYSFELQRK